MFTISSNQICFDYNANTHLFSTLILRNTSQVPIYFKFKVNRPRFYLVKPDRGLVMPNSTLEVSVKLHKEGISQANSDKFKCYFVKASADANQKNMEKFQERLDTQKQKLTVLINNLPPGLQSVRNIPAGGSQLKSLANTKVSGQQFRNSSTTFQSQLRQRQDRVSELRNDIQILEKSARDRKIAEGPTKKSGSVVIPLLVTGVVGLLLGAITSVWL